MPKKIRDYLFGIFIILFIVGTALISLYASGYKFNLSWPARFNRILIKTGMIAVDSAPRGATIYLNGQVVKNFSLNPWSKEYITTAAKIKNVLPGEYELRLEREGYLPLSKKISVYSGQTTFAEEINLFRQDLPYFIASTAAGELSLSPDRKYLYADTDNQIISLKNEEARILPLAATDGLWLKDQDRIFLAGRLFGPKAADDRDYGQLIGPGASDWHYDENQNRIYYRNASSLAYLDINDKTSRLVLSDIELLTYEPRGESLFLVTAAGGQTLLQKYSLKNQKIMEQIALPNVGHYRFMANDRPTVSLYDDRNKTLYLIDPDNLASAGRTIDNIVSWQWLNDDTLIYNNNWEIYRFDLPRNSSSLLTRVGEEIREIIWNGRNNYLIFSTADSLNAYDLGIGLASRIFQGEKIAAPILDEKNDTLYFWAQVGQQAGIYSLRLQ
ncbi:MAG: PEGA domain-containing protein [Patescibacteria group bacterium]